MALIEIFLKMTELKICRYLPNQSNVYSIFIAITIHKWSRYCYKRSVNYLSSILGTDIIHGSFDTRVANKTVLRLEHQLSKWYKRAAVNRNCGIGGVYFIDSPSLFLIGHFFKT